MGREFREFRFDAVTMGQPKSFFARCGSLPAETHVGRSQWAPCRIVRRDWRYIFRGRGQSSMADSVITISLPQREGNHANGEQAEARKMRSEEDAL